MIDPALLLTYSLIVLGFVFIPGPATLLTVARATTSGTRVGIATGAGITAGDVLHTIMAVVGIAAIIPAAATPFPRLLGLVATRRHHHPVLGLPAVAKMDVVCLGQRAYVEEQLASKLLVGHQCCEHAVQSSGGLTLCHRTGSTRAACAGVASDGVGTGSTQPHAHPALPRYRSSRITHVCSVDLVQSRAPQNMK